MRLSEIADVITLNQDKLEILDSVILSYRPINSPLTHVKFVEGVKREIRKKYILIKTKETHTNRIYTAKLKETQEVEGIN